MKKSIWIFLFAVLLPGFVLGWLALRSAEEQQIIFERRTAELYQKETESLAASAREVVEGERRAFGDTVHRLLARSDAEALARDFTNSLMDAWPRKAVGFVLGPDGEMLSPTTTMAAKNGELRDFLWNNGSFLCSTQPAVVYPVPLETGAKAVAYGQSLKSRASSPPEGKPALSVSNGPEPTVLAQKGQKQIQQQRSEATRFVKELIPTDEFANAAPPPRPDGETNGEMRQKLAESTVPQADRRIDATAPQSALPQKPESAKRIGTAQPMPIAPSAPVQAPKPALAPAAPAAEPARSASIATLNRGLAKSQTPAEEMSRGALERADSAQAAAAPTARASGAKKEKLEITAEMDAAQRSAATSQTIAPLSDPLSKDTPEEVALRIAPEGLREPEGRLSVRKAAPAGAERPATKTRDPLGRALGEANGRAGEIEINGGGQQGAAVTGRLRALQPETESLEDLQAVAPLQGVAANSAQTWEARSAPDQSVAMYNRLNVDTPNRMVEPQQQVRSAVSNWSAILPATADFRALTAGNDEGMLARFVQDKLDLVFWIRPPEAPEMVFGCLIEAADLDQLWKDVFASRIEETPAERPPFVLALLNDKARPVATFPATATATGRDWKRPFVANEIGEVLPHWEAALYLATPTAMADTARGLRRTLSFTIAGAIALIAIGGWLVVHDVRRQLALAQQKTDFVSNVSHELKTPLTSIRMFAELMHDRPPAAEKQGQYLRIIQVEAERLTRLINNVLDFAKLERRQKRFEKKPLDLCAVITRVWEGQEMHLRDAGFTTRWQAAPGPYPVLGDEDALAQILVNLLSNAEKYSQERKDIELVTWLDEAWVNASILDRGIGVPDGEERKIFEAFYRAHDSLSSGIQGSGLGLTLAQRVAREHGGEIVFERRQDGGSRFTLRLPLVHDRADDPPPGPGAQPGSSA